MKPGDLEIQVSCYAGYRGEETPRHFNIGRRRIDVVDVIDRWLSPEHRYFKVKGDDEAVYILRHDVPRAHWELIMFDAQSAHSSPRGEVPPGNRS
jgi:hypothetical protein